MGTDGVILGAEVGHLQTLAFDIHVPFYQTLFTYVHNISFLLVVLLLKLSSDGNRWYGFSTSWVWVIMKTLLQMI